MREKPGVSKIKGETCWKRPVILSNKRLGLGLGEASHPMVKKRGGFRFSPTTIGVHRQQVGMAQNGDLSMNGFGVRGYNR
jgi:hypothetical protein